jgi:hypothetical protein
MGRSDGTSLISNLIIVPLSVSLVSATNSPQGIFVSLNSETSPNLEKLATNGCALAVVRLGHIESNFIPRLKIFILRSRNSHFQSACWGVGLLQSGPEVLQFRIRNIDIEE